MQNTAATGGGFGAGYRSKRGGRTRDESELNQCLSPFTPLLATRGNTTQHTANDLKIGC
jgi:hypothetical protein